jgi:eukaryotic-like serine/threonine-protein kinase
MSPQDPTLGADSSRDGVTPTEMPPTDPVRSLDSLQTQPPSSHPDTRFKHVQAIPFQGTTDTYATAHPDATPTPDRDFPPDAFPGYELLEKIGEGGMAIVYKARQEGLNRLVAFKMILGGHRAGPKDLIQFLVEAEAVASIKHPNVVQVHEYGEADNRPFLAMEYLPGGTLADRLKREGRIAPKPAAELVAKLARAVQAAHDQEIVHRDLKPANVLFDAQDEPKSARVAPSDPGGRLAILR